MPVTLLNNSLPTGVQRRGDLRLTQARRLTQTPTLCGDWQDDDDGEQYGHVDRQHLPCPPVSTSRPRPTAETDIPHPRVARTAQPRASVTDC